MRKYITSLLTIVISLPFTVGATETPPKHLWTAKTPFEQKLFIENLGQYALKKKADAKDILFGARQEGMQYFFTKDGLWIKYTEKVERTKREMERFRKKIGEEEVDRDGEEKEDNIVKYKFVDRYYRMEFVGAGVGTTIVTEDKVSQYFTFRSETNTSIKANGYKKIIYKNLYPNIDMEFYFPEDKQGFKYNLILHPGADLSQIKINYPTNEGISLNKEGNVVIKSIFGDFTDHAPVANDLQTNKSVSCYFQLQRNTVSFLMPGYNKMAGAIIDPWTTTPVFAGGNAAFDVDWDISGNCYAYGGTSPFQLVKFNAAGVQLWTYTNSFSTTGGGSYYGDFAVNRLSGSAFLVDGFNSSGAGCEKVNLNGGFAVAGASNPNFQEMWRITYSRCTNQVVIAGGGTTSPSYTGATFDTSLTGINIANVINSPTGLHDMWGVSIDAFGSAYFATAKTQVGSAGYDNYLFKVPTPALTPITYSVATTYSFVEVASVTYPAFTFSYPNGFNGMAMSNTNLYMYDSYNLQKWNIGIGTMTAQANINGPSQNVMTYGGLAADECDHVFVGLNNSILQYDGASMTQVGTIPLSATVYDLSLATTTNILFSCGNGFVTASAVNLPPCTILQTTCAINNASCTNPVGSATLTVTGGTPAYNITWNTAPVQTGSVVTNLSAGNYTATVTDNSCPPLTTIYTLTINQTNGIAVTPQVTNVACNGGSTGAINIVNTSTAVPTYTWSTGSNASSITNLGAGTYSVTINGGSGCNMNLAFTVTQPPPITYTLTHGTLVCFGDTASINAAVSGGTPAHIAPTYTVAWNPPNTTAFAVHGLGAGNYGATITDSLGCSNTFTVSLVQPPQITPSFSYTSGCFGSPVQFTDQSTGGPFTWSWTYGDGSAVGTIQNPSHTYSVTGTYSVTLTVTSPASCTASVTNTLTVSPPPQAAFVGDTLNGCPVVKVNFTDNSVCASGTITTWIWNFGNGNNYTGQFPGPISYNNSSATVPATYSVSLTVVSSNGCSSIVVKNNYITVYPVPKAAFSFASDDGSQIDVLNNDVHFFNQALGVTNVSYYLGDVYANPLSLNYTNNPNPIHQYKNDDPDTYYITQWVQNQYGCKDSITEPLVVHPVFTYYVPTAFSPDGDGLNDLFKGTGIGIDNSTYVMLVFDRWGNQLFKANDLEKGWDGRGSKGDIVQEDVYVWKATFKDTNGMQHDYHGTVSVIK